MNEVAVRKAKSRSLVALVNARSAEKINEIFL